MRFTESETMNFPGASRLKNAILSYWREGMRARIWVAPEVTLLPVKFGKITRYMVRSNMKNGLPIKKVGE